MRTALHFFLVFLVVFLVAVLLVVGVFPDAASAGPPRGPSAARGRPAVSFGPCLQDVRQRSAVVMWRTTKPAAGTVWVRPAGSGSEWRVVKAPSVRLLKKVRLSGLTPGTRYEYKVSGLSKRFRSGVFRTAVPADKPFTFLVMGDTRFGHRSHRKVIKAMASAEADFVIHTGDIVDHASAGLYHNFFSIERPILRRMPLYPVLGNHELNRSKRRGLRLFRRFFSVPQNGPIPGVVYFFDWGNARFFVLDSNEGFLYSEQTGWIMDQLRKVRAVKSIRHVFVAVHYGAFSAGRHGPNFGLHLSGLVAEFLKHGVDMIFSGHDHIYDRGRVGELRYVVTGGGGAPLKKITGRPDYSQVSEATHNYVRVQVDGDKVSVIARRSNGSVLDAFNYTKKTVRPPSTKPAEPPEPAARTPERPTPGKSAASRSCGCRASTVSPVRVVTVFLLLCWLCVRRRRRPVG